MGNIKFNLKMKVNATVHYLYMFLIPETQRLNLGFKKVNQLNSGA